MHTVARQRTDCSRCGAAISDEAAAAYHCVHPVTDLLPLAHERHALEQMQI